MNVLDLAMDKNDSGSDTIHGYLIALLRTLWEEGEGFSGKRPFGNSGWDYDLYKPLIRAELVEGSLDDYGHIEEVDEDAAREIIDKAIIEMCKK